MRDSLKYAGIHISNETDGTMIFTVSHKNGCSMSIKEAIGIGISHVKKLFSKIIFHWDN